MKRKSFLQSCRVAFSGLKSAFLSEPNIKLHLIAAALVLVTGATLQIERADWLWLTIAISMVFIAEYLNTAIERLTDLVSPKFDSRAGDVKDIAAGAVLLASITALVIGGITFYPYVFSDG